MAYLLALKLKYPKNLFMLRGNHESALCTNTFGFRDEVLRKFDEEIYDEFI